ncbi:unnamed protein product, partial [Prorocentrum cordatum]
EMRLAPLSAQTLDPEKRRQVRRIGFNTKARMQLVDGRLHRHGIMAAGFREGRTAWEGRVSGSIATGTASCMWVAVHIFTVNNQAELLVFTDANYYDAIEGPSSNAAAAEYPEAFDLVDVATFLGNVEPTWFGTSGHDKCSDHIWASAAWIRRALDCGVLQESISFSDQEGHLPVWAQICYEVFVSGASTDRRLVDLA